MKAAIVTGSGSGIGFAIAGRFVKGDYRTIITRIIREIIIEKVELPGY